VAIEALVDGDSPVALPLGNTLATNDRTPRTAPVPPGPPAFAPIAEAGIGDYPEKLHEVKPLYPEEARQSGIEGQVVMRVGIDRRGHIHSVRVVRKAGHGFDQAAEHAMWKFKFRPARTRDGQAVDFVITYTVTFREDF
jgi:protein TonB